MSHRKLMPATTRQGCHVHPEVVLSFACCFRHFNQEFNPILCLKTRKDVFCFKLMQPQIILADAKFFRNSEIKCSHVENKLEKALQSYDYDVSLFSLKIGPLLC